MSESKTDSPKTENKRVQITVDKHGFASAVIRQGRMTLNDSMHHRGETPRDNFVAASDWAADQLFGEKVDAEIEE